MGIINRFDQPAQAQFINTYVPIPFDELAQAAATRQATLDENLARLDAAQAAAANLNYIPNSRDQLVVENWQRQLNALADEYIDKDLSDPEIYRKLRSSIRQAVDPSQVKQIQESYAGYQDYQRSLAQMQSRGEQVYQPFDFTKYNTLGTGIFNQLPIMDLGDQASMAIDKFLKRPEANWREVVTDSGRIGIEKYRDLDQIYNLINSNTAELMSDPAIRQFMEKKGLDEEGFKKYLTDLAPNYEIIDAGNFAFYPGTGRQVPEYTRPTFVETPSYPTGEDLDVAGAGIKRDPRFDTKGYAIESDVSLERFTVPQREDYLNIRQEYDDKIQKEWDKMGVDFKDKPQFGEGRRQAWRQARRSRRKEIRALYKERNDKMKEYINENLGDFEQVIGRIVEAYPELARDGKATQEQIWQGYNQVMDDLEQISIPAVSITEAQRKAWGRQLADQANLHSMFIEDAEGKSLAPTGFSDTGKGSVLNEVGMGADEFMAALRDPDNNDVTIAGFSVGQGSEPGQIILNVADKKGKSKKTRRTVYISTNLTNRGYLLPMQNVYNQIKSGKQGIVPLGYSMGQQEIGVNVVPYIDYNSNEDIWNFEPVLARGAITRNDDNTFSFIEKPEPISYQQLVEEFLYDLFESGGLGSNLMDKGSTTATQ